MTIMLPKNWKLSEIGVLLYFEGKYDDAVRYLTKAADLGDSQAQTFLGICYRYGQGVIQNDSLAARWYETTVENDQNPEVLFALARYHEEGKGGFVRND